jgi:flagellar basal body-associated protein FliL
VKKPPVIFIWQPLSHKNRYTNERFKMKRNLKTNILIFFTALVLIAVVAGYMMWNKPHENVKDASAVRISAIDLYKIFTADSAKARSTYLNTVVAVSGEVKQVSHNQQNQQVILLKTQIADAFVNCTMEENANNIKAGDSIVLKGICSGYIGGDIDMGLAGDVFLTRCYIST